MYVSESRKGGFARNAKDKWSLLKVFMRTIYIWFYKHGLKVCESGDYGAGERRPIVLAGLQGRSVTL